MIIDLHRDPAEIRAVYAAGIAAFERQDLTTALEQFDIVRAKPTTTSAQAMNHNGYWERTISSILQKAVDLREQARTKQQFEAAARGPAKILEIEPEHPDAQAVLRSITQETKERRTKRRPKKVQITGVQ